MAEIRSLLNDGQKNAAVKLFREQTGCGLAEAKAAVEQLKRRSTTSMSKF